MAEIVNRVAQSKLKTIDLEDLYLEGERVELDISQWLYEGLLLREKDFRSALQSHNWEQYSNKYIALHCSTDAIIPSWAFILISVYLNEFASKVVRGSLTDLELVLYTEQIGKLDLKNYQNLPVIIKGCSNKPVPETAYLLLLEKLQPIAKSIMYGEACSSVPLFKRKKSNSL